LSGYDSSYAQQRLEQQQDEQFVVQQLQKNDANNAAEQAYGVVSPNEGNDRKNFYCLTSFYVTNIHT
jgi:hypothetical protein